MKYVSKKQLRLDILRGIDIFFVFGRHREIPRNSDNG